MKHLVTAACLVVATLVPGLAGAETAQQQKMKDCNAQATAKQLKGNDRQTFMAQCLKAGASEHQLTAQQQKMKDCNAQAAEKHLKGKDRKSFMSQCLSGKSM
jgi:hypothetical protein